MGRAGGGRNVMDPRFVSLFHVYNVTSPTENSLNYIYTNILQGHLNSFQVGIQALVPDIVNATLELFHVRN